jgi:hypothetical protein
MALAVICGFVSQKQLSLVGRTISLTLIARRSRHFAGTRYRKRGINNRGHVANDVETEQIVHHDASRVHPVGQHYTSFVQVRGSAPVYWSQETGLAVQPKIDCNIIDPAHHATMLHFSDLMMRYGCPIVCLNLVKEGRDKNGLLESSAARRLDGQGDDVHREVKLANEYAEAFEHLNKSLPRIRGGPLLEYTHRDLRRIKAEAAIDEAQKEQDPMTASMESMVQGAEVTLPGLEDLSVQVEKLGFFNSEDVRFGIVHAERHCTAAPVRRQLQRGVVRSNCVDSLDRTNTAQFHLGLYALGHQLHALRVLPEKNGSTLGKSRLDLSDSDDKEITIVLAQLYEDMGNTIALQYGGSEAHQFMLAKLEGRSEFLGSVGDAYKSVRRYYANSISDQEKQGAINLFLGKFDRQFELMHRAEQVATRVDVWELGSDWQLHNREEDWPLPSQTGQHNDFFSGDLKWWENALARYDERILALEAGSRVEMPPMEPEPEAEVLELTRSGDTAIYSREGRRQPPALVPTHVFAQQYGLCRCDRRAAARCKCPGVLSSFGGPGSDPGMVSKGLMDDFAAKIAFVKAPYVTAEAKEVIDQEIEAEVLKESALMRGFDGTTASQMSWMSERPPPAPPAATGDGAGYRLADADRATRRTNSLGRAAMQHKDSIKTKHKLRREWIKEYIGRTEMEGLGNMSRHHLLVEGDTDSKQSPVPKWDGRRLESQLALTGANTYAASRYMEIEAAAAAAAAQEQQLDRLRISRQTQDPSSLQPNSLSDNKAIYEDYVLCRQQRDAVTAHLLHQLYPLTSDEANHGSSLAEAQSKADEKEATETKLNQMTLGALRDLAHEIDGLDKVTVETAVLSEDLGLAEIPLAVVAANAAARAEEDALGIVREWRDNESWQSGRHAKTSVIHGEEHAEGGVGIGLGRESCHATERLQEQLRRRLLEKLGRPFGRTPAPLFEAGDYKHALPAASQAQGVAAAAAGQHTNSTIRLANASHVVRDLQSCCDITCGGSKWNDARKEHDTAKLLDARILEMLLGRHGLGVVDGGPSESSAMSSYRIYELLVCSDAMDTLIEQLRASLSRSLSEEDLIEDHVHFSESELASHGRRGGLIGVDGMTIGSEIPTKTRQTQEFSEKTSAIDSEQDEQDEETGAMRGITRKTSSSAAGPSLYASADPLINAQRAGKLFEVGGDYDSLLCRVGGVSKAYHRLMVPGRGHYHTEYNRQRTQDEPEVMEDYRDDAFLTGVPTSAVDTAAPNIQTELAEGLKLLIDLQLGTALNATDNDSEG